MPTGTGRYIDFVAIANLFEIGWQMSKIRGAKIARLEPISLVAARSAVKYILLLHIVFSHQEAV
jgi:hypothetical protein